MPGSVSTSAARQPDATRRTVSHADPAVTPRVTRCRTVERQAATAAIEQGDLPLVGVELEVVRAVMERHHVNVTEIAKVSGASRTQIGEALDGRPGRNFCLGWIVALHRKHPLFVRDVLDDLGAALGFTPESQRQDSFDAMVAILKYAWFRPRRAERSE